MFGESSTSFLKELIKGKEIEIIRDIDLEDPYGRELVHVMYKGRNVNELLIKGGLARVAYLYDEYKFINEYKKAEEVVVFSIRIALIKINFH